MNWLAGFGEIVSCHSSFLSEMRKQLEKDFNEKTGYFVQDKFTIFVPTLPIENAGKGCQILAGDLISLTTGISVRLAWQNQLSNQPISPESPVNEASVKFWWIDIPDIDSLKNEEIDVQIPWRDTEFSFEVDFCPIIGVDMKVNILIAHDAPTFLSDELIHQIQKIAQIWNNQQPERGMIHHISNIQQLTNELRFEIDLGTAYLEGLYFILKNLHNSTFAQHIHQVSINEF
jgi:hypothetical protein